MTLAEFNHLAPPEAEHALLRCCASPNWAARMLTQRPYPDVEALLNHAEDAWWALDRADWLAAFAAHPEIGAATTNSWSREEQQSMADTTEAGTDQIRLLNRAYRDRFGYIFLICATGKTAQQMHSAIQQRLLHAPEHEMGVAAAEQAQITALRLRKLFAA